MLHVLVPATAGHWSTDGNDVEALNARDPVDGIRLLKPIHLVPTAWTGRKASRQHHLLHPRRTELDAQQQRQRQYHGK